MLLEGVTFRSLGGLNFAERTCEIREISTLSEKCAQAIKRSESRLAHLELFSCFQRLKVLEHVKACQFGFSFLQFDYLKVGANVRCLSHSRGDIVTDIRLCRIENR